MMSDGDTLLLNERPIDFTVVLAELVLAPLVFFDGSIRQ
jgi:hypothetical protein